MLLYSPFVSKYFDRQTMPNWNQLRQMESIQIYIEYTYLKRLSHQAGFPLLFNFPGTVRTQENQYIFREKLSVTASLQRPRHCHGALMAFYRVPTVFMVEILCALTVLFHCASTSLTAHVPRFHSVATALRMQWHLQERLQSPCKRRGRPRRLHNDPCVRPRSSYCVVGDFTARLWWPYGVPSALY